VFGQFAYVANVHSDNVSGYRINASTAVLTPIAGSAFAAATEPISVEVNPAGKPRTFDILRLDP
jgi:hypothetical protein